MTDDPGHVARWRLARSVLARHAGAAVDATAVGAAASRAYDDLAHVLAPVIGDVGVAALTDRAMHLAAGRYPWLPSSEPGAADIRFTKVIEALSRQNDPAAAADAAAAIFESILGLLSTFIGEPLAARLVKQGWPDAVSSADTEET